MLNRIATELHINESQVERTVRLLDDGATVPFLARYRKEVTGNLDEEVIRSIRDKTESYRELEKRRTSILSVLEEQKNLTPELEQAVRHADTLSRLEDLYLPYRPKKRTKGSIAKERGLEPLADILLSGGMVPAGFLDTVLKARAGSLDTLSTVRTGTTTGTDFIEKPEDAAVPFINPDQSIFSAEDALAGAREIIAERINEHAQTREALRDLFQKKAVFSTTLVKKRSAEEAAQKYKDYFSRKESVRTIPSHRVLASLRGVNEGYLSVHILPEEAEALDLAEGTLADSLFSSSINSPYREQIRLSLSDSYKRLLAPSLENELRNRLKTYADEEAIKVFAENLRDLLLSPPLGRKATMGIDPGQRTGCKVVCLNSEGALLATTTVYPLAPHNKKEESAKTLRGLAERYSVEAVAVGNGTGGRETLAFCEEIGFNESIVIASVNESGASVYSASQEARKEFPDYDVTVRGAVSIARRLMDPLAELVKIEPKAIGVGQYQHDVDQKMLKDSLDDVVASCVNNVGVELNSASEKLLEYVSGLTSKTAAAVIEYRTNHGGFTRRDQLRKVKGLGPKAFEQCAGFLRIRDAEYPLDRSAVHPERYPLVERIAEDMGVTLSQLIGNKELCAKIHLERYADENTALSTLHDIRLELEKPGRDPRETFKQFHFREDVKTIEDLREGMILEGIVTNVTDFGAFIDIGVHQDGLVHISEMSDSYVSNPRDIVKVHQPVTAKVISIDIPRKRIGLSIKN